MRSVWVTTAPMSGPVSKKVCGEGSVAACGNRSGVQTLGGYQ